MEFQFSISKSYISQYHMFPYLMLEWKNKNLWFFFFNSLYKFVAWQLNPCSLVTRYICIYSENCISDVFEWNILPVFVQWLRTVKELLTLAIYFGKQSAIRFWCGNFSALFVAEVCHHWIVKEHSFRGNCAVLLDKFDDKPIHNAGCWVHHS